MDEFVGSFSTCADVNDENMENIVATVFSECFSNGVMYDQTCIPVFPFTYKML